MIEPKLTIEIQNTSLVGGMSHGWFTDSIRSKAIGETTLIEFTMIFKLVRQTDNKIKLQVKIEGGSIISKRYYDITERNIYSVLKEGADYVMDTLRINDAPVPNLQFLDYDLLYPDLKKLLVTLNK